MSAKLLLVTPPFTQLNTPYPGTVYLKGFLDKIGVDAEQMDLGIEVILRVFSGNYLQILFSNAQAQNASWSDNTRRILANADRYVQTVDNTIAFLQGRNNTLARRICSRTFLPEAARFAQCQDMEWGFGAMGLQDKAKFLATMYLEDLSDFIQECIDPHFGFSRYAERLGRSANQFDELYDALQSNRTAIEDEMLHLLQQKIIETNPSIVGFSVPFPGNLFAALRCGQWIKRNFPNVKVAMGGGFPNTELRSLTDARVFEFLDFVTLDDGEAPVQQLLKYVAGIIDYNELKRTFILKDGEVQYINNKSCGDFAQAQVGTPSYAGLPLSSYISALEVVNPMHSLWSDGRWNKLTMAHGCYWGKCTFCDTSLDYIKRYEPLTASVLCDRVEQLIAETGQTGFHFVDEAAPPALMQAFAVEVLRRGLVISWWANVRFEKSFTRDLCMLLKESGCIAVSGGLEVASDRLLQLIDKGITVAQVAKVNKHFTEAGIMIHAYLMYGFPTQTAQETIDSLEIVRQMFVAGILQSGFWHQFAMTAHSPVGMNPEKYKVVIHKAAVITFADNDVVHEDPTGADHAMFSEGLKTSLHNYMHANCLDWPLHKWFDFKVPKTTVAPDAISKILEEPEYTSARANARVVWLGNMPTVSYYTKAAKGNQWEMASLTFYTQKEVMNVKLNKPQAEWLIAMLPMLTVKQPKLMLLSDLRTNYNQTFEEDDFELFWDNKPMNLLYKAGLLVL